MTTDEGLKLTSFVHRLNGWCMLNCFPPPSILVCWLVKEADLPASCIFFFWCPMLVLHPYCQTPSVNKPKWVWIKNTPFLLNVVDLCTLSLKVQHDLWVPAWTLWVGGRPDPPIQTQVFVTTEKLRMRLDDQLLYMPDLQHPRKCSKPYAEVYATVHFIWSPESQRAGEEIGERD